MINTIISFFTKNSNKNLDLLRFARIEYKKENPEYVLNLLKSGEIFKK